MSILIITAVLLAAFFSALVRFGDDSRDGRDWHPTCDTCTD